MLFLLANLLVLAAVAAAAVFAYAHVQPDGGEDWPATSVDYGRLHAHWAAQRQACDWHSLREQVCRWHAIAAPGAAAATTEQIARDLNAAVFRFAVPGEALAFQPVAAAAREARHCPATRRSRAVRWPL